MPNAQETAVLRSVISRVPVQEGSEAITDLTPYIGLATQLIQLLRECRASRAGSTPAAAASIREDAKNPRLFQRMRLRRAVRQSVSPETWAAQGDKLVYAALKAASEATPNELAAVIEAS